MRLFSSSSQVFVLVIFSFLLEGLNLSSMTLVGKDSQVSVSTSALTHKTVVLGSF